MMDTARRKRHSKAEEAQQSGRDTTERKSHGTAAANRTADA